MFWSSCAEYDSFRPCNNFDSIANVDLPCVYEDHLPRRLATTSDTLEDYEYCTNICCGEDRWFRCVNSLSARVHQQRSVGMVATKEGDRSDEGEVSRKEEIWIPTSYL